MCKVYNGQPIFCVPNHRQFNLDDQTQVVWSGNIDKEKDGERMIHKVHYQDNRTRAPVKAPATVPIAGSKVKKQAQNTTLNPQRLKVSHQEGLHAYVKL
jgi:hypothetical protein